MTHIIQKCANSKYDKVARTDAWRRGGTCWYISAGILEQIRVGTHGGGLFAYHSTRGINAKGVARGWEEGQEEEEGGQRRKGMHGKTRPGARARVARGFTA